MIPDCGEDVLDDEMSVTSALRMLLLMLTLVAVFVVPALTIAVVGIVFYCLICRVVDRSRLTPLNVVAIIVLSLVFSGVGMLHRVANGVQQPVRAVEIPVYLRNSRPSGEAEKALAGMAVRHQSAETATSTCMNNDASRLIG